MSRFLPHWRALCLFCGIVWRYDQSETRMDWRTAWTVTQIVYYRAQAQRRADT